MPIGDVLSRFDRLGVCEGWVASYRALYQNLKEGNLEAAQWAQQFPQRIHALGILHPAHYGDSPERLLRWMSREAGIRAVALFSQPAYYPIRWDAPVIRAIGRAAAREGIVLHAGIETESDLNAVCAAWGSLKSPVMIRWMAGHRYKSLASEVVAAKECRNFYFDVSNLCSVGGIEWAAKTIGAKRLFFASNTPHFIDRKSVV